MKIVILYSGGLDSKIMEKWAKVHNPDDEIIKVYYNIGAEYNWKEIQTLEDDVIKFDMPWFAGHQSLVGKHGSLSGNIFIPGRNLAMACLAACQFLPDEIWLGALLGEMHQDSTDKNWGFANVANSTFEYVLSGFGKSPKIRFPLAEAGFGKLEATRWGVENGLTDEILQSSSCLSGEVGNCGKCVVCLRRAGIFHQLGLDEPYNVYPFNAPKNIPIVLEMLDGELGLPCHYDEHRRSEIMPAIMEIYGTNNCNNLKEIFTVMRNAYRKNNVE